MAEQQVHVGEAYVYADESRRLARKPAPTKEAVRAEDVAAVLRDIQRDPERALADLERLVRGAQAVTEPVEELVGTLTRGPDLATGAKYVEPLTARIVRDYQESRLRDVVRLVRAAIAIYLLTEKWRELVALLQLARLSAEELEDAAETAWAVNDLGVLAGAAGLAPLAGALFEQAGDLFEQAGDHVAAEAASQAASLVPQAAAHTGVALGVKIAAGVAGAVVLAGGAAGVTAAVRHWSGGDTDPGTGRAQIVAFAPRQDHTEPSVDEESGADVPDDAVDPGGTLEACRPLYLDTYVRVGGVEQETTLDLSASVDGEPFAPWSEPWARPEPFTTVVWWFVGQGGQATEPLPYGRWDFLVRIGDVEVDEAEVTLEESC